MLYSTREKNLMLKGVSSVLYDLPAPMNISVFWNFGSLLGSCLGFQILSGLLLVVHYSPDIELAFYSVVHICRDVNFGWLFRSCHANGASLFFVFMYLHICRGIYYQSYKLSNTWLVGVTIFLLSMMVAFLGYILPWGQMSFWGATVITNLLSAIPYIGFYMVEWVWGGFSVGDATLKRFFVLHFLIPFVILCFVVLHVVFLHSTGSNNPLGIFSGSDKIPFYSYFMLKDLVGMVVFIWVVLIFSCLYPNFFLDPVNFCQADPLSTPLHIQPEWYFLFAYSILRSIPNKLGGVVGLVVSVTILYIMPFYPSSQMRGIGNYCLSQVLFWVFAGSFLVLTYLGTCPVEAPFQVMAVVSSAIYFLFFIFYPVSYTVMDFIIFDLNSVNLNLSSSNYNENETIDKFFNYFLGDSSTLYDEE